MAQDPAQPNAPEPPKQSPEASPIRIRIKATEKKADTARIDLKAAHPPPAIQKGDLQDAVTTAEPTRTTMRVGQPVAQPKQSDTQRIKSDTHPIDTEASKKATMRVALDAEKKKSETTRLEIPPGELAKRSTTKITEATSTGPITDAFGKKIIPTGIAKEPPPAAKPPPAAAPVRPKTISVRPPAPAATPAPPPAEVPLSATAEEAKQQAAEARRSETARIDLPAESVRPATRPKTIRIKRADGTTARKPLMIARPAEDAVYSPTAAPAPVPTMDLAEESEVGTAFSVLALLCVLVSFAVAYVLAASLSASLPLPGRL